jgi:hypothetical protein
VETVFEYFIFFKPQRELFFFGARRIRPIGELMWVVVIGVG